MKWLSNLILTITLGGLIVLAGVRLTSLLGNVPTIAARVHAQQEATRPALLDVVVVTDGTCPTCTNPKLFVDALAKQPAVLNTLKQIDGTTEDGKRYLAQQKLESFPVVVVSGETSRSPELEQFLIKTSKQGKDNFIYYVTAPYHEVNDDKVRGFFRTIYLTAADCGNCYDVKRNAEALKGLGVSVVENKVVTATSAEGKALVKDYKIRYLPTIVLVGDLEVYQAFQSIWPQVGSKESGGTYVLRDGVKLMGTYYDLQLKRAVTPKLKTVSP